MDYVSAVANVGFPIAVTFYLLFRFEPMLQQQTRSVTALIAFLEQKFK